MPITNRQFIIYAKAVAAKEPDRFRVEKAEFSFFKPFGPRYRIRNIQLSQDILIVEDDGIMSTDTAKLTFAQLRMEPPEWLDQPPHRVEFGTLLNFLQSWSVSFKNDPVEREYTFTLRRGPLLKQRQSRIREPEETASQEARLQFLLQALRVCQDLDVPPGGLFGLGDAWTEPVPREALKRAIEARGRSVQFTEEARPEGRFFRLTDPSDNTIAPLDIAEAPGSPGAVRAADFVAVCNAMGVSPPPEIANTPVGSAGRFFLDPAAPPERLPVRRRGIDALNAAGAAVAPAGSGSGEEESTNEWEFPASIDALETMILEHSDMRSDGETVSHEEKRKDAEKRLEESRRPPETDPPNDPSGAPTTERTPPDGDRHGDGHGH